LSSSCFTVEPAINAIVVVMAKTDSIYGFLEMVCIDGHCPYPAAKLPFIVGFLVIQEVFWAVGNDFHHFLNGIIDGWKIHAIVKNSKNGLSHC